MKKYLVILLCLPLYTLGQEVYTMRFMSQLPQSQWTDASNQQDNYLTLGLPVISDFSAYFYNSGFTFNQLFQQSGNSLAIHPADFINNLKNENYVGAGLSTSLLSFTIKPRENVSIGFSINDRADFSFSYPKEFLNLLWNGNGSDIGKTVDIGNFGINGTWYREYALHASVKHNKWTFGASPKLLFGKSNINTANSSFKLYTDTGYYALTGTANMNIETSDLHDSNNTNLFTPSNYFFNNQNMGLAIDFSARYEVNERISVSAGVNDLGYIHWKSGIYNYEAGPSSFTFNGFNANNYFQGDSNFISAQKLVDSVSNLVKFTNNVNAYTTYLPYNFFAMGTYKINKHIFGLQFSMERFYKSYLYAATASYQIRLGNYVTADLTYTAKTSTPFNIGGALIFQAAAFQLFFITDNWWAPLVPLDSKNINLQFGINLVVKKNYSARRSGGDDETLLK